MEAKQAPALADFETTEYFFYLNYPGCTGECLHYCDAHQPSLQKVHDLIHIFKAQTNIWSLWDGLYRSHLILVSAKKRCLSFFKIREFLLFKLSCSRIQTYRYLWFRFWLLHLVRPPLNIWHKKTFQVWFTEKQSMKSEGKKSSTLISEDSLILSLRDYFYRLQCS